MERLDPLEVWSLRFPRLEGAEGLTAAFTGSRRLSAGDSDRVFLALLHLGPHRHYVTGAATGVDAFAGQTLYMLRPGARHTVVVPADRSRIRPWWVDPTGEVLPNVTVIEMDAGTTYRNRNLQLIARGDVLYGWPEYPEEDPRSARSGSWQTIRMARRAKLSTFVKTLREP